MAAIAGWLEDCLEAGASCILALAIPCEPCSGLCGAGFGEDYRPGSGGTRESNSKRNPRGKVEGFTLVLLIGWLVLLAAFGAMYRMDQVSKKAAEKQTSEAPPRIVRRG